MTELKPGEQQCPNCGKVYKPIIKEKRDCSIKVQEQFPDATPLAREQLISACCTKKCYKEFDGGEFGGLPMGEE